MLPGGGLQNGLPNGTGLKKPVTGSSSHNKYNSPKKTEKQPPMGAVSNNSQFNGNINGFG